MRYDLLADAVTVLHFASIIVVTVGALAVWRWNRLVWLHVPAVAWAVVVEFTGWICPLTPLETSLRLAAGADVYTTGFVEHYLVPLIYPGGLTRSTQMLLGALVLCLNVPVYYLLWRRRTRSRS